MIPTEQRRHGDRFTIVIVPTGAIGQEVLEAASQWTESGLLSAAAWVRPEDVLIPDASAPVVTCHFLGKWGDADVDLFETLGQYTRDLVRVVCCQVLPSRDAADGTQAAIATRLLEMVRYSVPALVEQEGIGRFGTTVMGVNVLTGVTGLSGMPRTLMRPGWDVTVVTSPEDRRDPSRANTWVRAGENLTPVALTSAAVVGGLFAGVPEGPFDQVPGDASSSQGRTIVQRATVRAVIGERVVQEIARSAVAVAPATGTPALQEPESFTTSLEDSLVEDAADWLDRVDQAALSRQDEDLVDEVPQQFMSIRQGFLEFMRFYGQALLAGPRAIWAFIVRRAESMATGALVGGAQSSGIALSVAPNASIAIGAVLQDREAQEIAQIRSRIREHGKRPVRMPSAETWRSLRSMAEGLLDGSELPAGAIPRIDGTRRVLLPTPDLVAPRPDDTLEISLEVAKAIGLATEAQRRVPACAPSVAERISGAIHEQLEKLGKSVEELDAEYVAAKELADVEEEQDGPAHKHLEVLAKRHGEMSARRQRFADEDEALSRWMQGRTSSLMWTVGSRIQHRVEEAKTEEAQADTAATTPSGLNPDEPARLRRRFLRWFTALLVLALVGVYSVAEQGVNVVDRLNELATWVDLWQLWVVWIVVILVLLTLLVRSWYVGVLAYLRRFTTAWNSRSRALFRYFRANSDRRRLEASAEQAATWSDVIGWTSHTPWTTELQPLDDQRVSPDPALLPASMRLAQPSLDDFARQQATEIAMAQVTSRGWRRRAYERLVAASTHSDDASGTAHAIVMIDSDLSGVHGARARLQESLASGNPQQEVVNAVIEEAAGTLRSTRLGAGKLQVQVEHPEPDEPATVDNQEFLRQALVPASPLATETWSHRAQVDSLHAQLRTVAWAPKDVAGAAAPGVQVTHNAGDSEAKRDLVDVVVRVDLTGWVDVDSLRLFDRAAEQGPGLIERDVPPGTFT